MNINTNTNTTAHKKSLTGTANSLKFYSTKFQMLMLTGYLVQPQYIIATDEKMAQQDDLK